MSTKRSSANWIGVTVHHKSTSIDSQATAIAAYAKRNGLRLIGIVHSTSPLKCIVEGCNLIVFGEQKFSSAYDGIIRYVRPKVTVTDRIVKLFRKLGGAVTPKVVPDKSFHDKAAYVTCEYLLSKGDLSPFGIAARLNSAGLYIHGGVWVSEDVEKVAEGLYGRTYKMHGQEPKDFYRDSDRGILAQEALKWMKLAGILKPTWLSAGS